MLLSIMIYHRIWITVPCVYSRTLLLYPFSVYWFASANPTFHSIPPPTHRTLCDHPSILSYLFCFDRVLWLCSDCVFG